MRLAIFGATGPTGRLLVEQALRAGHEVVALTRTPGKLGAANARLIEVNGDATDPVKVEGVVRRADAVLSALGVARGEAPGLHAASAKTIVAAMRRHNVRRLVLLSVAGLEVPGDRRGPVGKLVGVAMARAFPGLAEDRKAEYDVVRESGLDWTVVRLPRLTDGERTGRWRLGTDVRVGGRTKVSRADVAEAMLRQLDDRTLIHKAPVLAG